VSVPGSHGDPVPEADGGDEEIAELEPVDPDDPEPDDRAPDPDEPDGVDPDGAAGVATAAPCCWLFVVVLSTPGA
jgi:hypothetical protein